MEVRFRCLILFICCLKNYVSDNDSLVLDKWLKFRRICSEANQLYSCSDRIELHTMSMSLYFVSECKGLMNGRFDVYFENIAEDNNADRILDVKFMLSCS